MTVVLRDYQQEALAAIRAAKARGVWAQLVVLPTGSGKTVIFGALTSEMVRQGHRVLLVVHRDELLGQTVDKLLLVDPQLEGRIGTAGAGRVRQPHAPVLVGMVQTLARRPELIQRGRYGLVVLDEAHHAVAGQWLEVVESTGAGRPGCLLVGVTATPNRLDGLGLGTVFQEVVYSRSIQEMVAKGVLVPPRGLRLQSDVTLDRVRAANGDLDERELQLAVNTEARNRAVVAAVQGFCTGRKTVVFAAGVAHAETLARQLRAAGIRAAHVDGAMGLERRREVLADFRAGRLQVVTNCNVLTEGFDEPAVAAVVMARPTASEAMYIQQVGRGLRRYPGKTDCLVVDVVDVSSRHRLVQLADLFGHRVVAATLPVVSTAEPSNGGGQEQADAVDAPEMPGVKKPEPDLTGLQVQFQSQETELISPFDWVPVADGWVLVLPEIGESGRVAYVLVPDVRGRQGWLAVEVRGRESRALHPRLLPVEWCQGVAESAAQELLAGAEGSQRLVERAAAWRSRPCTAAQVETLRRLGVEVPEGLTAGEASRRITAQIWRRRVEWLTANVPRLLAAAGGSVGRQQHAVVKRR